MRTLVGAAEPEPAPAAPFVGTSTSTTSFGFAAHVNVACFIEPVYPTERQPYRTTAHVGRPLPEIGA